MKIRALEHHPRRERVRLLFEDDAERRPELALDLVLRAGLAPGDVLSEERLAALLREDEGFRARDAALSLLSHRARSTAELRRRLLRKNFDEAVVERTVETMAERGYLDDRAFAESFVRDRLRLRPRGRLGLIQELRRRGVEPAVAEAAVTAVMEEEVVDEAGLAADAAAAWARRNRAAVRRAGKDREERARARRRLYAHLARRGFGSDAIRSAINAALGD